VGSDDDKQPEPQQYQWRLLPEQTTRTTAVPMEITVSEAVTTILSFSVNDT